jgi:hypothetical protein
LRRGGGRRGGGGKGGRGAEGMGGKGKSGKSRFIFTLDDIMKPPELFLQIM